MNFKKYHVSKNLFDKNSADIYNATTIVPTDNQWIAYTGIGITVRIPCEQNTTYAISIKSIIETSVFRVILITSDSVPVIGSPLYGKIAISSSSDNTAVFTTLENTKYFVLQFSASVFDDAIDSLMVNTGSQPLPYEPYDSEVWHDIPHYIMGTDTDTLTTLPADVYANDTSVTVGLKGQMEQTGTPSPATPIQPSECGDLETTGEHTGQYKIPILNNSQTTNVYLGEVESTRRIKKYEVTGNENWMLAGSGYFYSGDAISDYNNRLFAITTISTHYKSVINAINGRSLDNGEMCFYASSSAPVHEVYVKDSNYSSAIDFKAYLAQQYAAGTPVTIWYVLTNPETAVVNEPLRKIGTYADEVSNVTLPTTAGANTLSVGTTLQPSEVTVNYKGWHSVADVHERENGAWD